MTISFIGAVGALANSIALPSHQAGDLIEIATYDTGSGVTPSLGSGYISLGTHTQGTLLAARIGYKIATSSSETSGTWSGASFIAAKVYRGASGPGAISFSGGNGTDVTIPSLTLNVTDGTSWVLGGAGHRSQFGNLSTPPSGMVLRHVTDDVRDFASYDTNGGVSSWSGGTVSHSGSADWIGYSLELLEPVEVGNQGAFFAFF